MRARIVTLAALLGPVGMVATGCGPSSDPQTSNPSPTPEVYSVSLTAAAIAGLPKCTSARAGTVAYVSSPSSLWTCTDRAWHRIECSVAQAGEVAYASATQTLWACVARQWTPIALPEAGPPGEAGPAGPVGPVGPPGEAGPAGPASLVAVTAEQAGGNCAAGGQRIDVGIDTNGDGVLEAGEVQKTAYVCNGLEGEGTRPNDAGPEASTGACSDPTLGVVGPYPDMVEGTAAFVQLCQSGGCGGLPGASWFFNPSQAALDYGDFPFRSDNGQPVGDYFFAVVAPGYEESGFLDGAPGNLSDTSSSEVAGDRGSGDTRADRTITISEDQSPALFPTTHGSHAFSFPPSQFMAIALAPFDVTPDGRYELAVCPTSATSRCDCAFAAFGVVPAAADAGGGRD